MSLPPHVLVDGALSDAAEGDRVEVAEATLHHLRRVLRLGDGAGLSVTDGAGRVAGAELVAGGVRLRSTPVTSPAPGPRLVLAQALSKGRRAEDAVRTACELGVDVVVPVVAERTQGRPDAKAEAAIVGRWRAVASAALEQSRGTRLPTVTAPASGPADVLRVLARTLADAGDVPAEVPGDVVALFAVPGASPLPTVLSSSSSSSSSSGTIVVAVGPEGGWSDRERAVAADAGWHEVGLGPSVLRTEHAGPVALAVLAALTGRWSTAGGSPDPSSALAAAAAHGATLAP